MARLAARVDGGNMLERLCICSIAAERVPSAEAGMNKAWGFLLQDEVCKVAQDMMGPFDVMTQGEHSRAGRHMVEGRIDGRAASCGGRRGRGEKHRRPPAARLAQCTGQARAPGRRSTQ
ncbi:MAG: hypothetical protein IPG64_11360 [Haliea sp.]|nr:hypothetical protein [Haliea sp.]